MLVVKHEKAALGGQMFEDQIHDKVQDFIERLNCEQRFCDLNQYSKYLIAFLDLIDSGFFIRQVGNPRGGRIRQHFPDIAYRANVSARTKNISLLFFFQGNFFVCGMGEADGKFAKTDFIAIV